MSQENLNIRGHSVFNRPANLALKMGSVIIDLCCVTTLSAFGTNLIHLTPILGFKTILLLIFSGAIYLIPSWLLFRSTLGQLLWRIKFIKNERNQIQLLQQSSVSLESVFLGSLSMTLSILIAGALINETIFKHPIWINDPQWRVSAFNPDPEEWLITPFFYSLGAWPKKFQDKTLTYSLPYEKGPPQLFIGHVVIEMGSPDIQFILEGPKTPKQPLMPSELKTCFTEKLSLSCFTQRAATLTRHLEEIQERSPRRWNVRWFSVSNPLLPPEAQAQGVYLSAEGKTWIEDRFILINESGTQQALILKRNKNELGKLAFETIQKTLGSLRLFNELNSGRAWVNRELEAIHLKEIKEQMRADLLSPYLSQVQSLLISKISVEPMNFDSYFHLAGTSTLILKNEPRDNENFRSALKRNIRSAYNYANDVGPQDPRTLQIKRLIVD